MEDQQLQRRYMELADRASVRGYGRFLYTGATDKTKKGKYNVSVQKYV